MWRLLLFSGRSACYSLFLGLRCVPRGFIQLEAVMRGDLPVLIFCVYSCCCNLCALMRVVELLSLSNGNNNILIMK